MKKLVLAALAIASMAACTKSNVQYEQPGEITLQPVAQKATKAAVDGTAYPTAEAYNFNVWAWWADKDAGTQLAEFTPTTDYIAEGTFVHRNGTSWGGSTPYYWPTKGSLVFAGYSPASAKVGGTTFKYYLNAVDNEGDDNDIAANTLKITDYIQSNNIADAKDLMWFDVTDESYNKNGADNKVVPVTFKHALSWLTFKFNRSNNTDALWTIKEVKLVGIEDKATFTAVKTPASTTWKDWAISAEGKSVVNIYTAPQNGGYIVGVDAAVIDGTDITDDSNTNVKNNAVLVIPQSCAPAVNGAQAKPADAELVITYNQKTYVDDGVLEGQTVTLPLNSTEITGNMWEPGKHYIYTITFGAEEILIAPAVTDWTDVTVNSIPVK